MRKNMSQSFDKILKKGKSAANNKNPVDDWKKYIGFILWHLQALNDMYIKKDMHHVAFKSIKCEKCGQATYLALVRDAHDPSQALKFHLADWKAIDDDTYECPNCKK